ncbi:NAD(P)/FAD-dependent oxidoreductase [Paenibacillus brasilensis]|uniref:Glycine/D-amino acid oxidase-like deaminating enzyme n=1 Tax=Paenibacillus brasilensis TaxID=128574 RepID=A0ABU0KYC3_9BACL|nr:FAD-dependent oxidoreductase [Paenibacillus brasilensis]MDQ0494447.1 glycine/D-amino acid oxidase-like deaminating enzyme [Paenibacillus brasilensis]
MDLISGNTFWPSTLEQTLDFSPLAEDLDCDVLIIGGGMSGSLCSRLLGERNVDTVVIDKRKLVHGSSSANTGLLQYSNDKTLTSFINTFGGTNGVLFYRMCKDALDQLEKLAATLDINPSFIRRSSLYYASTTEDVQVLQEEYKQLTRFGFPVEYWDEQQVAARFPFRKTAALYTHEDAEVNPFQLAQGLFQSASRLGVRIFEHTDAKHFEFGENEVVCHTSEGTIRAKKVISATGYETQEIKADRGATLESSYAIVTTPVEDISFWHEQCLIWETARPYLYMRTTQEGRIITGGLDEPVLDSNQREIRLLHQQKKLLQALQEHFPDVPFKIDYAWAAVFGSSHDGLPYIGPHPRFPNCCFLEGYGGNGAVTSMIAAQLLADELTGTHRPEMELFSLTRTTRPAPETTKPLA